MKIFYSWQTDTPGNRNYIGSRLREAVRQVDGWEIETATRNTAGAPDIAATILSKIDDSDLFLADVSIINPNATDERKKCPNPNVMYELGYAVAAKGQANIILVANKDVTNTSELPFDIRNRRIMIKQFNETNKAPLASELSEILRSYSPPRRDDVPKIELITDRIGWANWTGNGMGSGFLFRLRIDNLSGNIDYIEEARVTSVDAQGNSWQTTYFIFEGYPLHQMYEIEENRIVNTTVFLTDAPNERQRQLPDIDQDIVKLVIKLRSDHREIEIPIPTAYVVHRNN